jgi:hypothetical protein
MAATGGNKPSVQKGNGGRPGTVQWQSYDRERDDDDSLTTMTNRAFGCSPINVLFYVIGRQPCDDAISIADCTR